MIKFSHIVSTCILFIISLNSICCFAQQSKSHLVKIDDYCSYYEPLYQKGLSATWTGKNKDGLANGFGILKVFVNGSLHSTYEGSIINGHIQGKGKRISASGTVYEGNFEDGELNGYGIRTELQNNEESIKYEGNFVHYWMHGDGKIEYANGDTFKGKINMNTPYTGVFTTIKGEKKYIERGKNVNKLTRKTVNYNPQIGVQQKEYFDEKWERCDLKKAKYYRLVTYKKPNWPTGKVVDYYVSGGKQSVFNPIYIDYDDDLMTFCDGSAIFYHENGIISQRSRQYGSEYKDTTLVYYDSGEKYSETIYEELGGSSITTIFDKSGDRIKQYKTDEKGNLVGGIKQFDADGRYIEVNSWNFADNPKIWESKDHHAKAYVDKLGRLKIDNNRDNYSYTQRTTCNIDQRKDYMIESVVEQVDADDSKPYGIIFGYKDWDNYLEFVITGNQYYGLFKKSYGRFTQVIPYRRSSAIYYGDNGNRIHIWKIGSEFIFEINGTCVDRCDAYKLAGEGLGFIASGKGEFAMHSLIVRQFSSNVDISTVIPTERSTTTQPSNRSSNDASIDASGSGFAIDKRGFFATNFHVVKNARRIYVCLQIDGIWETYNANIVKNDQTNDLSIIKIEDSRFRPFTSLPYNFSTEVEDVASEIYTLGYPQVLIMGSEVKYTIGVINSKSGIQGDPTHYQISAHIDHGNSGGPMFNSKGSIIGITDSGLDKSKFGDVNYAIKSLYLKSLVDALPIKLNLPDDTSIMKLSRVDQIKVLSKYTALILVDLP